MRPYPFKTKPYKHQMRALKEALRAERYALLMEPRTGKTKVSIDYLSALALAGRIDRAVVVAPARVLDVWVEQFHMHCPIRYHVIVWDAEARKHPIPRVSPANELTVLLVNYDAFTTPGPKLPSGKRSQKSGRFAHRKAIEKWVDGRPAACVLDESHKIKSPSGKAATMLVSMRPWFNYRLILTGTPITKATRVFDIYMQWKFLNPERFEEWPDSQSFKDHFGQWTNRNGFPQLLKVRHTDQLAELMGEDSIRVARAECFDLPPRTDRVIPITLGPKTGAVYDELAAEMVARIEHDHEEHIVEASIPLVLTLRLTQITGGFGISTEKERIPLGGEKLKALEGLVDETIENDEKMVVAARFRDEMDEIVKMVHAKGIPVYQIRGGLSRSEVTANIEQFKRHRGAAVCCMNPQAGSVGIDLSTAAHMVWYSLTPSWVDFTQACDRIALSDKATTFTYLLAKGTVDDVLYGVLRNDGDVSEAILRNPRMVLRKG